jgi:hypothetical protein
MKKIIILLSLIVAVCNVTIGQTMTSKVVNKETYNSPVKGQNLPLYYGHYNLLRADVARLWDSTFANAVSIATLRATAGTITTLTTTTAGITTANIATTTISSSFGTSSLSVAGIRTFERERSLTDTIDITGADANDVYLITWATPIDTFTQHTWYIKPLANKMVLILNDTIHISAMTAKANRKPIYHYMRINK